MEKSRRDDWKGIETSSWIRAADREFSNRQIFRDVGVRSSRPYGTQSAFVRFSRRVCNALNPGRYLNVGFGGVHTDSNQRLMYTWA